MIKKANNSRVINSISIFIFLTYSILLQAATPAPQLDLHWIKVKAQDKFARSQIADMGLDIEGVQEDYVTVLGSSKDREELAARGMLISSFSVTDPSVFDFPIDDANYHNYTELIHELKVLENNFPNLVQLDSIGSTYEQRELWHLRITANVKDSAQADQKPGIVFMGAHHAREHLSVEVPLMLAQHLLQKYQSGDPEIVHLINSRDIHIIPMVNPDGAEFDIHDNNYHLWRKNRKPNPDKTFGVDLNRNYSYKWGTGGSSKSTHSDTYMGPAPFSEPETQSIKKFIENQRNISTLLTFHTFSELILYPWGHTYNSISNDRDAKTFAAMAETMAAWNGYKPEQTSSLYIASGDTTDWAYGEHHIFAFTFELDPSSMMSGGFYLDASYIPQVFEKNLKPCLYLINLADNPYRALEPVEQQYGLSSLRFVK